MCRPLAMQPRTSEESKITRISLAIPTNVKNWEEEREKSISCYSLFQETVKKSFIQRNLLRLINQHCDL